MRYLAGVGDVSIPTRALFSVMLRLGVWPASRPISRQVRTCSKQALTVVTRGEHAVGAAWRHRRPGARRPGLL